MGYYSGDPVADAQRYYNDCEEQSEGACHDAALRSGHTKADANLCDDGSLGCPDCPFKEKVKP